jgi:mannose-6-phosphate isomerase-like protein (cupin superfamily)
MNYEDILQQKYPEARWYEDGFSVDQAKHSGELGEVTPSIVKKPWGFEIWLVYNDHYAHKLLVVLPGKRLSLQRHKEKTETWIVEKGEPQLTLEEKIFKASPGQIIHVPVGTVHRMEAQDHAIEIREISTPELWDVERLNDDFGRN